MDRWRALAFPVPRETGAVRAIRPGQGTKVPGCTDREKGMFDRDLGPFGPLRDGRREYPVPGAAELRSFHSTDSKERVMQSKLGSEKLQMELA